MERIGPSTNPYGTPDVVAKELEDNAPKRTKNATSAPVHKHARLFRPCAFSGDGLLSCNLIWPYPIWSYRLWSDLIYSILIYKRLYGALFGCLYKVSFGWVGDSDTPSLRSFQCNIYCAFAVVGLLEEYTGGVYHELHGTTVGIQTSQTSFFLRDIKRIKSLPVAINW